MVRFYASRVTLWSTPFSWTYFNNPNQTSRDCRYPSRAEFEIKSFSKKISKFFEVLGIFRKIVIFSTRLSFRLFRPLYSDSRHTFFTDTGCWPDLHNKTQLSVIWPLKVWKDTRRNSLIFDLRTAFRTWAARVKGHPV